MRRLVLALSALLGLFAAGPAFAQADFPGVRAMSMGEAVRSFANGASAVLLNPAGMALNKQYVVEGFYGIRIEDVGHQAHVSIVDSVTTRVAAGLYYNFLYATPRFGFDWAGGRVEATQATRTGHTAGLSLAIPLGQRFSLGATVKYLNYNTTAPLPMGTVPKEITFDSVNGVSFDVGLIARLGDRFNVAVVGYNLWDHGSKELPLSLGLGVGVKLATAVMLAFDSVINFSGYQTYKIDPMTGKVSKDGRVTGRFGPGLEWLIKGKVPLRAGVVYDSGLPGTFISAGFGYVSSQWGIDLGYRGKVQGGVENTLMLGLRLFVN